ncbi:pyridine nucleotide-disulfide oxidoreductase [Agromyces sp. SYSU K20354]|uniref:pyridine nucleotide-disulfide oxidoreductase n=1 Tax=Agromyces cavernae TaxID=2898659 RepID=UPI001E3ED186|nr:pyridine nucleotide-disulfide oxidoreductase [Agromyces cavernae]MCD2440761.1 pyridine nucleotide-disulfide oxidoreductase [Agromyces cavernae]
MTRVVEADYLVVGAGATGMAFTDTLIDHADVGVAMVDRRHGVGGHWLEAYPFVRLHQASAFYGVASTLLGRGRVQRQGPEAGLQERATRSEICAYYERLLARLQESGGVEFFGSCEYVGDRTFVSRISGEWFAVPQHCRIVDANYLSPRIPAEKPPPFDVADDARVIPVNELARLQAAPSQYVIVGSGKTATDTCVWLLAHGVDPDAICWVRPREPWMLNRAVVQPDPVVFIGMVADTMQAAEEAASLEDLFLRLEDAGIMLRIDPSVVPTMAKTPTLAEWELEVLRTIEHVVRLGHIDRVQRGRVDLAGGSIAIADDAIVVHCAGEGLRYPPLVPVWGPEAITLQPIRAGFPCFGAALIGYVEATRDHDDEKNRLCPPSPLPDSMAGWARMSVLGARAAAAFGSEPDIKAWADRVALNPARIPPERAGSAELRATLDRVHAHTRPGLARLAELGGVEPS